MKNAFIAVRRVRQANGQPLTDDDGAFYLEEHPDSIFTEDGAAKEFAGPGEIIRAVTDYKNQAKANGEKPRNIGEVIILNILEF